MVFIIILMPFGKTLWFRALLSCHCSYFHRLISGFSRPDEVLECIERGVDLFESFFPYQVTERGCALTFSFDYQPNPEETCRSFEVNLNAILKFLLFPVNFWPVIQSRNMCIFWSQPFIKLHLCFFSVHFGMLVHQTQVLNTVHVAHQY